MPRNHRTLFRQLTALLPLCLLIFSGCHRSAGNGENHTTGAITASIIVDGITRRYAIHVPEHPDGAPRPLVFELHGGGVRIEDMTGASGYKTPYRLWMTLADKENFIIVYPEGLDGVYGRPTWHDCRADATVYSQADDVRFIAALIEHISASHEIDARRIYASGTSNGGLMALRLAVELPQRFSAVAAVVAAMPANSQCEPPTQPVSVLFMNGTDDNHLPWNGGLLSYPPSPEHGAVMSTEDSVQLWVDVDQCRKTPVIHHFPDIDPGDGSTVTHYTYAPCTQGNEVILYKVEGGGHSAPSIRERYSALYERRFNRQNHDIEMTTEVWRFFRDKRLQVRSEP